jgi:nucleoside-diphosphate-sugar epimerase
MARIAGREIALCPSPAPVGGTPRRCPDISKIQNLGYRPRVTLDAGLPPTLAWYFEHEGEAPVV